MLRLKVCQRSEFYCKEPAERIVTDSDLPGKRKVQEVDTAAGPALEGGASRVVEEAGVGKLMELLVCYRAVGF